MKKALILIVLTLALSACDHAVQTTSGQDYLSAYKSVPVTPSYRVPVVVDDGKTKGGKTQFVEVKSVDQRIREAAALEPILKFPARIGLARIDGGRLSVIPPEEGEAWTKTRDKLGASFGEFVPVNPMIAQMAEDHDTSYRNGGDSVIDIIRLGAARQHLDAVLMYEVASKETTGKNLLSAGNLTIIGGYVLPSQWHDADGTGTALLIDVVQGYPYGTLTTTVQKMRLSSSWGWGSDYKDTEAFELRVKTKAAQQLADEAYDMFRDLRTQLVEKAVQKKK